MSDDWGLTANAPSFSLFKDVTPEEAAEQDGWIDGVVYLRWKKGERRLYQRLKTERIARQVEQKELKNLDDITSAFDSLTILKKEQVNEDPMIDDLLSRVSRLQLEATRATK